LVNGSEWLAWEHDGSGLGGFKICVDAASSCQDVGIPVHGVFQPHASTFAVPLPALLPGLHTLAVIAYDPLGALSAPTVSVTVASSIFSAY
jgi:hypothetical protein